MEQQKQTNTSAVVALICGIISVLFAFLGLWLNIIGLICAIVALIFAIKARKQAEKKGMSTAGLVLGIVGCSLCPIFLACNICVYSAVNEVKNGLNNLSEEIKENINEYENKANEKIDEFNEKVDEAKNKTNEKIDEFNEKADELNKKTDEIQEKTNNIIEKVNEDINNQ